MKPQITFLAALLLLLGSSAGFAQQPRPSNTPLPNAAAPDLGDALLAPAVWENAAPLLQGPGSKWEPYSCTKDETVYRQHFYGDYGTEPTVLGVSAAEVRVYASPQAAGVLKISRIEVTYLEVGYFVAMGLDSPGYRNTAAQNAQRQAEIARFNKDFQGASRALATVLGSRYGASKLVTVGANTGLRTDLREYAAPPLALRILTRPNQLLQLTMLRQADASRNFFSREQPQAAPTPGFTPQPAPAEVAAMLSGSDIRSRNVAKVEEFLIAAGVRQAPGTPSAKTTGSAAGAPPKTRSEAYRANVTDLPNGDRVIENIPMVNQGTRGYCAEATLAMVANYYHVQLTQDDIAARVGISSQRFSLDNYDAVLRQIAAEGRLRLAVGSTFLAASLQAQIDRGHPVLIWHQVTDARTFYLQDFASQHARDGQLLPPANEDRKNWVTPASKGADGHASLLVGYNRQRGEAILMESWGARFGSTRMRTEELAAGTFKVLVLEPY